MRKRYLYITLSCLFTLLSFSAVKSGHLAALNITYVGIDTFSYVVTVSIYRDCRKTQFLSTFININYESFSCGLSGSATLDLITGDSSGTIGTGNFIQLPCLGIDTCDPSILEYSVEEFVYQDTIVLPDTCNDWIISYETSGLRNYNGVLVNPTAQFIYVSAMVNNVYAPGNSSPNFIKPPVAIFCTNRDFFFNQGAVEADGDSIYYSLDTAQGSGGNNLTYVSPFTPDSSFPVNPPGMFMNPFNGILLFTPSDTITSVLSVNIDEYRDGILIGSIKNDMQVYISDSCTADTLNFKGDTTTSTGIHPAITALCKDISITIHFDNPIQCETISLDGSDFIITSPVNGSVSIIQIFIPICTGGYVDSLVLILSDSMRFNGSYYIFDTIGTDFIPILSECGLRLNDTLEVRLRDCVKATVDLLNVTVVDNSRIDIMWSKYTENFQEEDDFIRYDVHRSLTPSFGYDSIASIFDFDDTTFSDNGVAVTTTPYNYLIKMILDTNLFLAPVSDSIQSILLGSTLNQTDTNILDLAWTRYWGWNPTYEILESIDNGPWAQVAIDTGLTYAYTKSLLANSYRLKIRSSEPIFDLVTESNWIDFNIAVRMVPNIITPNEDGVNDFFFVNEQLLFEPIKLIVYNRWGMKVFEDDEYQNNWDGDNFVGKPLVEGTYYYLLILTDAEDRAGFITIIR